MLFAKRWPITTYCRDATHSRACRRARSSSAKTRSRSLSSSALQSSSTRRFKSPISKKPISPVRKAATASSLAALSAAHRDKIAASMRAYHAKCRTCAEAELAPAPRKRARKPAPPKPKPAPRKIKHHGSARVVKKKLAFSRPIQASKQPAPKKPPKRRAQLQQVARPVASGLAVSGLTAGQKRYSNVIGRIKQQLGGSTTDCHPNFGC